jgi:CHAT domain-containing protein
MLGQHLPHSLVFPGRSANENAFREHAGHATIFHFAGHGVSYGGFGALLLARSDRSRKYNPYLTADAIAGLDLSKLQLVVLAACSSGVGEQSGTVNLDSLTRAFLEAGARRVIAANWDVDSARTAGLMSAFYNSLREGEHPAEALRRAQVTVRFEARHPYYWAGFQVFGAP